MAATCGIVSRAQVPGKVTKVLPLACPTGWSDQRTFPRLVAEPPKLLTCRRARSRSWRSAHGSHAYGSFGRGEVCVAAPELAAVDDCRTVCIGKALRTSPQGSGQAQVRVLWRTQHRRRHLPCVWAATSRERAVAWSHAQPVVWRDFRLCSLRRLPASMGIAAPRVRVASQPPTQGVGRC
jgi:hypothetical protein